MVLAKDIERIFYQMPSFNGQDEGDLSLLVRLAHLRCRTGYCDVLFMPTDRVVDGINLGLRRRDARAGRVHGTGRPDREKHRVDAALTKSGEVDVTACVANREIPLGLQESLGGVAVGVNDDGLLMEPSRTMQEFVVYSIHGGRL